VIIPPAVRGAALAVHIARLEETKIEWGKPVRILANLEDPVKAGSLAKLVFLNESIAVELLE
jgi:hypothetical protein